MGWRDRAVKRVCVCVCVKGRHEDEGEGVDESHLHSACGCVPSSFSFSPSTLTVLAPVRGAASPAGVPLPSPGVAPVRAPAAPIDTGVPMAAIAASSDGTAGDASAAGAKNQTRLDLPSTEMGEREAGGWGTWVEEGSRSAVQPRHHVATR